MRKGRSEELISKRDQKIFERYFYWTEIERLRFDDALEILANKEFFLSEQRVMVIVRKKIQEGATVNGKKIFKPLFTSFHFGNEKRRSSQQAYSELQLFPE